MSWQSFCFRRFIPVAAPGWIYKSREFPTKEEAQARAVVAMTERYGDSLYRWLTYSQELSIHTVEVKPLDPP